MLTLGWRIQMAMRWATVSRDQLAEILGVSPSTISRWCSDEPKRKPARAMLEKIAEVTYVDPAWLIRGEGELTVATPAARVGAQSDKPRQMIAHRSSVTRSNRLVDQLVSTG